MYYDFVDTLLLTKSNLLYLFIFTVPFTALLQGIFLPLMTSKYERKICPMVIKAGSSTYHIGQFFPYYIVLFLKENSIENMML